MKDEHRPLWQIQRVPSGAQPTALALLLALVAWPIVAATLGVVDLSPAARGHEPPAPALVQWSAAAGGVFIPALIAGTRGGFVVRRHAILGGVLTFVFALSVAQATVLLLPTLLGQSAGVACESLIAPGLSSSGCNPNITNANALDVVYALWRTPFLWLAPIAEPVPVLALAIGVGVWTRVLARRPNPRRPATWS